MTLCIYKASRKHSLLLKAVFTVAISAELTEMHLVVVLKDIVSATDTGVCLSLFFVHGIEQKYWILVIHLKLIFADSHYFIASVKTIKSRRKFG